MKFEIEPLLRSSSSDPINCVEIYICPNLESDVVPSHDRIPVRLGELADKLRLSKGLGSGTKTTYVNYHYNNLCYTYDMTSDAQKVTHLTFYKDSSMHIIRSTTSVRVYATCMKEDTLPSHRFPCTREMTHKSTVHRTSYRVNNRLFLHHDRVVDDDDNDPTEYMYLRYNHVPQVDLVKLQNDIDHVLNTTCFDVSTTLKKRGM